MKRGRLIFISFFCFQFISSLVILVCYLLHVINIDQSKFVLDCKDHSRTTKASSFHRAYASRVSGFNEKNIFNCIISSSVFPTCLKVYTVVHLDENK